MKSSTLKNLTYLEYKLKTQGLNNTELNYYKAISKIFMKRINNILKYNRT